MSIVTGECVQTGGGSPLVSPDVDACVCVLSLDDVLIGAPLFMARVTEQLQERGQVWSGSTHSRCLQGVSDVFRSRLIFIRLFFFQVVLYLQRRHAWFSSQPDQSLIGSSVYGRFGSALTLLGDLDMDGYHGKQLQIKIVDRALAAHQTNSSEKNRAG